MSTVILAYALYSSLNIIWALMLIIFMIQTIAAANIHKQWRTEQREKFENHLRKNEVDEIFANAFADLPDDKPENKAQNG